MAPPAPPTQTQDPAAKASWGDFGAPGARPDAGVFALRVQAAWDETPTLRGLRLRGPAALIRQYQTPGQYLELMHAAAGSAYFALAAAPSAESGGRLTDSGTGELELLVRRGPGLAGVLAALEPEGETAAHGRQTVGAVAGDPDVAPAHLAAIDSPLHTHGVRGTVVVGAQAGHDVPAHLVASDSPLRTHGVRGAGFALDAQAGRDVLLVAAGSGIAPLRAVLQVLQRQRQRFGRITLYYGERLEADFAYRRELRALQEAAVALELVLTRPSATWHGGTGYVQTHLRAQPPAWLGPDTAALLCGQPAMLSEATTLLLEHRVPPSQILLNY